MVTFLLAAGLGLALVLLVALHYRLGDLPFHVWSLARREREADAPKALDLMKEAVAAKAGVAVLSIQRHEEGLAAGYRAQVAEVEMRARVGERRAADTATALAAATTLVRELRQVLDRLPQGTMPEAVDTARKPGAPEPASRERLSPRMGLPLASEPPDEDERPSEEELTKVADRPRSGSLGKTLVSPTSSTGGKP
jgi:hypothetical protein